MVRTCECGCGSRPTNGRRFVHNHHGRRPVEERFWEKVKKAEHGCWKWIGAINSHGYGHLVVDGKYVRAHRLAFELHCGPIPTRKQIHHICENRSCVNPEHLAAISPKTHVRFAHPPKEVCKQGHKLVGSNLYLDPRGGRQCKTCRRESLRKFRAAA